MSIPKVPKAEGVSLAFEDAYQGSHEGGAKRHPKYSTVHTPFDVQKTA